MSKYARRKDGNQDEIVDALVDIGANVFDASFIGKGFPDLVVGIGGHNFLVEAKSKTGRLTPAQIVFHQDWRGKILVARDGAKAVDQIIDYLKRYGAWNG